MSAETTRRVSFVVLIVLLLYFDFKILELFLAPLTWAAILAILFFPLHRRLQEKLKKPNLAALLSVLAVTSLLILPSIGLTTAFVRRAVATLNRVEIAEVLPKVQSFLERSTQQLPVGADQLKERTSQVAEQVGAFLAQRLAQAVGNFGQLFLHTMIMMLALFYLFRDGPRWISFLREISPMTTESSVIMFEKVNEVVKVTIGSILVVAVAQGICAALSFWVLDLPSPAFWGVVVGIVAIVPLIGAWVVWIPAAAILIIQGSLWKGIAMLAMGAILISGVDNVIRPMFVAERSNLNGLLVVISILGGIHVFGFLGIILGPLLAALTVGMLEGYRESLEQGPLEIATE